MNKHDFDDLEMQLRILGRQLGDEAPSASLIKRTRASAVAHLTVCAEANARRRSQVLLGTIALAAATLPIPLLFLWGDWAAASALFGKVMSPAASEVASSVYLWIRVCALSLIYLIVLPAVALWALRMNAGSALQREMSAA